MNPVIEADAEGAIHLPPEMIAHVEPHSRFVLEIQGDTLVLRPEEQSPFWLRATPKERAEEFRRWAEKERTPAPVLPEAAYERESMYD